MPSEIRHSPPPHRPGDVTTRPKGILKNPSFSGPSHGQASPDQENAPDFPPSTPLDPAEAKEITIQNTIQNAGPRRSSSGARRASAARRLSSTAGGARPSGSGPPGASGSAVDDMDQEKMRLKWDEANLYLAEQESGGRMKITEPKTPYQHGDAAMEEEEEDVAIDPRFVNVDEVDMKNKERRSARENEIPGLDIGEPEDEGVGAGVENDRIVRGGSLSRESSKDKHVSVDSSVMDNGHGSGGGGGGAFNEQVGMPTREEQEKHRQFEEQRKKHYEMRDVKGLLGHPEDIDEMDEDDNGEQSMSPKSTLPRRGVNGA